MKCYYAHGVNLYGTPQEKRDIVTLEKLGFEVYNPNRPEIQEKYKDLKMAMFEAIVKGQDIIAFRSYPDGSIPSGVHKEIRWALEAGMPVIELPNGLIRRGMSLEDTREYLHDCGER